MNEIIELINQLEEKLQEKAEEINRGIGGRELSLAITNLQQSRHWVKDAIEFRKDAGLD